MTVGSPAAVLILVEFEIMATRLRTLNTIPLSTAGAIKVGQVRSAFTALLFVALVIQ